MRRIVAFFCAILLTSVVAFAQNRTVTGQVTDDKGEPIGFATLKVKNGKTAVSADANGKFKIEAPRGATLVVTAVGTSPKEIVLTDNQSTYTVSLTKNNTELSTVVVTALGIKRSAKAVTYATQQISGERLSQARETDLTAALSGKIAGLQTLGQSGSKLGDVGAVRLRGAGALKEKFALYVVDGTILTNPADINMDDVESVNVLKGPNATALYGQRAEGGVIVITTKKAKTKKLQIDFNHSTTVEKIAYTQQYQNEYGSGRSADPQWKTFTFNAAVHPAEWASLNGKRYYGYEDDESWGPRMDGGDYIPWYAWYGGHAYSYKAVPYVSHPNNIKEFFNNGVTLNNNISLQQKFQDFSYRASYTNIHRTGIVPTSKQDKHLASTQLSYTFLKRFTANVNANYAAEKIRGDFDDTYGNQTTGAFNAWFHRDMDMKKMRELADLRVGPNKTLASWNHVNPSNGAIGADFYKGNYWLNPYDFLKYEVNDTWRKRLYGDAGLTMQITSDLKATATYRLNHRTTNFENRQYAIIGQSLVYNDGKENFYGEGDTYYNETNLEFITSYNKKFKDLTFDANVGGNLLSWNSHDSSRSTSGGFVAGKTDVFELSSSANGINRGGTFRTEKKVRSLFGRASMGYKDFLFVDVSGRQDWSSVLPAASNGYFYPSAGVGFVFNQFLNFPQLSFAKLRGSYAVIGTDDISPYALDVNYVSTTGQASYGNNPLATVPNSIVDPNILPTTNTSFEVGLDLRFLKDRLGMSMTYFEENKNNDIVTTNVTPTSGVTSKTINVGKVKRQGLEFELNAKPVRSKNFNWDMTFNWSTVNSFVEKVSDQQTFVTIRDRVGATGDQFGHIQLMAIEGQKWGQLRGRAIKRINGLPVIDPTTDLFEYETNQNLGSILPRYNGGIYNQFNYKGFRLAASVDFQSGGKFFSMSHIGSLNTGLLDVTAATNDNGKNVRDPLSEGGGVHVFGVTPDGHSYDTYVEAYSYFKQFSAYEGNSIAEISVFDASYVKLREVSLGYDFNLSKMGGVNKYVKRIFVSAIARNPFRAWTTNPGFDPSELSRSWGENGQLPGTKSYGVNLKLTF